MSDVASPADLTILGQTVREPVRQLETFPRPPGVTEVELCSTEWTSLCPVTGQPDFGTVTVRYGPRDRCLESKALKLYLWSFRDEPMFVEQLTARIAADVGEATGAAWVEVDAEQAVRGGIAITARALWPIREEP